MSGYDATLYFHERFGILVSSDTIYSLLYSLERDDLIKGVQNRRKRVYELTEKGERNIEVIMKVNEEIQNFLRKISSLNANACAHVSGSGIYQGKAELMRSAIITF